MTLILQIPAGIQKPKHHPDTWTFWSSWIKLLRCCIHQGTQWVPRNTVTEQIGNTTTRNLGIASGPSFFFFFKSTRGSWKKKILMDSHPYSHETSIFTLGAPHEEVQGRQTKLHPGFTMDKLGLVQPSLGISILRDAHIVLSNRS